MTSVLHVLARDDWGGTEIQVAELVRRASGERCRHVVAVLSPTGEVGAALSAEGHEVHLLASPVRDLARVLRSRSWGVVEAYGFRAAISTRLSMIRSHRHPPLLVGVRGLHIAEAEHPDGMRTRAVLAIERVLARTTAGYDANSEGARSFLISAGFPAEKFIVIPNGVEPVRREAPAPVPRAPADPVRLICVARFVPRKRQDVLVRALVELVARGHDVHCTFVGDGPTLESVRALADSLAVGDRCRFGGRLARDAVTANLLEADAFVLSSLWEGLPGSVLEAMSAGVAVVATDVSGTDEVVVHERNGLLVAPEDPLALAEALERIVLDHALRDRLACQGWADATSRYSFAQLVARKEDYFTAMAAAG